MSIPPSRAMRSMFGVSPSPTPRWFAPAYIQPTSSPMMKRMLGLLRFDRPPQETQVRTESVQRMIGSLARQPSELPGNDPLFSSRHKAGINGNTLGIRQILVWMRNVGPLTLGLTFSEDKVFEMSGGRIRPSTRFDHRGQAFKAEMFCNRSRKPGESAKGVFV